MSAPLFILRAVGSKENTVVKAWALEAHQSGASHVGRGEEQGGLWPSTNKHQTSKIVTELPIMEKNEFVCGGSTPRDLCSTHMLTDGEI